MKRCPTCDSVVENGIFCSKECYHHRRGYRKHSEETKQKIAIGNSKPFTEDRKRAISDARTYKPTTELLERLHECWELKYLNPHVIMDLCGLHRNKSVYARLFREHCKTKQLTFMPKDWYPHHYRLLIELGTQNVYYKDIAKLLGFGHQQTYHIAKKLGLTLNRRDPNAWQCVVSKLEKCVLSWISDEGYELETQFSSGNFLFDARVKKHNVLIEVNGDYWHCNPRVYTRGAINEMQKAHLRRDFAKKAHAEQMGYHLITVWELDVKERPEEIRSWLLKKVEQHATK